MVFDNKRFWKQRVLLVCGALTVGVAETLWAPLVCILCVTGSARVLTAYFNDLVM